MDAFAVLVGVFFIMVGSLGVYLGISGMRRETADRIMIGILVAIMSFGMIGIGVYNVFGAS